MRIKEVSSAQNPWFKEVKQLLEKNRIRKAQRRFTVEGFKEIQMALDAGFTLESVAFVPQIISSGEVFERLRLHDQVEAIALTPVLMTELAVRSDVENAVAIFKMKETSEMKLHEQAAVFILEGIEKPGNLGAILRTADASGIDAIWLCDSKVDPLHPQVIRNSLGAVFQVPVFLMDFEQCISHIRAMNMTVYTTFMQNAHEIYDVNMTEAFAVVLGTEHDGVQSRWKEVGRNINIPMLGKTDSLNVSVAAAVIMYEKVRQRRKN